MFDSFPLTHHVECVAVLTAAVSGADGEVPLQPPMPMPEECAHARRDQRGRQPQPAPQPEADAVVDDGCHRLLA